MSQQETEAVAVLPHALKLPLFNKLRGKRVVLASGSPRRKEILHTFGLAPEIVPSTFPETLSHSQFDGAGPYAVATGSAKAVEVYTKLVEEDRDNAPDLVIGADTVVVLPPPAFKILEKPESKEEQLEMLQDYNGNIVTVVTGVTLVQPQLQTPGYSLHHLVVSTKVKFADNPPSLLRAYVECGEGIDKAGGFAVQGLGGSLIKGIEGDYNNVVGFPAQAFFEWLGQLAEDGVLCEMD